MVFVARFVRVRSGFSPVTIMLVGIVSPAVLDDRSARTSHAFSEFDCTVMKRCSSTKLCLHVYKPLLRDIGQLFNTWCKVSGEWLHLGQLSEIRRPILCRYFIVGAVLVQAFKTQRYVDSLKPERSALNEVSLACMDTSLLHSPCDMRVEACCSILSSCVFLNVLIFSF